MLRDIWWAPQGTVSRRLDYIAAQTSYRRAVQKCKVNGSLGQRWQTGTVRDHWPVELHVRLRHEIRYKARRAGVRWNRHAVCRLSTDVPLREAFLRDAAAVIAPFEAAIVSDTLDQTRLYKSPKGILACPRNGVIAKSFLQRLRCYRGGGNSCSLSCRRGVHGNEADDALPPTGAHVCASLP